MINRLKKILLTLEHFNNINEKKIINDQEFKEQFDNISKVNELQIKINEISKQLVSINFNDPNSIKLFLNLKQQFLLYEKFLYNLNQKITRNMAGNYGN